MLLLPARSVVRAGDALDHGTQRGGWQCVHEGKNTVCFAFAELRRVKIVEWAQVDPCFFVSGVPGTPRKYPPYGSPW